MKNFTRAERAFITRSTATAVMFLIIARLQFWGIEMGVDVPVAMPTVVLWASIGWIALIIFCVAHRIVTSRKNAEVA